MTLSRLSYRAAATQLNIFFEPPTGSQSPDAFEPETGRTASPASQPHRRQVPVSRVRRQLQELRRLHVTPATRPQRLPVRVPHLRKDVQAERKPPRSPASRSPVGGW